MTTTVDVPFNDPNNTPSASATARPDHIEEKFWDAEKGSVRVDDLAKSYAELQKKIGAPAQEQASSEPPANSPADPEQEPSPEATAEAAGVDVASYEAKWADKGSLEDADYEALAAKGFDRETVDDYIQYRQGKAEQLQSQWHEIVGGEQALSQMQAWAAKSYKPAQIAEFNEAVESKKPARIEAALKALKADYVAANPARPKPLSGTGGIASSEGGTFASMAELLAAQKDPRYFSDAAYRAGVEAKLRRSSVR